jgi:hypothetical protein
MAMEEVGNDSYAEVYLLHIEESKSRTLSDIYKFE